MVDQTVGLVQMSTARTDRCGHMKIVILRQLQRLADR